MLLHRYTMNFHLNGVKFYGLMGKTVHSLDLDSSDSDLNKEDITMKDSSSVQGNISLTDKRNLLTLTNVDNKDLKKINLRQYFPQSLLNGEFPSVEKTGSDRATNSTPSYNKKNLKKGSPLGLKKNKTSSNEAAESTRSDINKNCKKGSPLGLKKIRTSTLKQSDTDKVSVNNRDMETPQEKLSAKRKQCVSKAPPALCGERQPPHPEKVKKIKKEILPDNINRLAKCVGQPPHPEKVEKIKKEFLPDNIDRLTKCIDFPCLGLNHVFEIQRTNPLEDVIVYCALCHARCAQNTILLHLKSFKHHLRCLEKYSPRHYERYRYRKKSLVCSTVEDLIRALEKQIGKGRITLKPSGYHLRLKPPSDSSSEESCSSQARSSSKRPVKEIPARYRTPSCSPPPVPVPLARHEQSNQLIPSTTSLAQYYQAGKRMEQAFSKPDLSSGDFFCTLCECHMSSDVVWESHVVGKRHRKNLKKQPFEDRPAAPPEQEEYYSSRDRPSHLYDDLERLEEDPGPIVGLDYITEVTVSNRIIGSTFNCHLCNGCFTRLNIVHHLCSTEHRGRYIKEVDRQTYDILMTGNYSDKALDYMVGNRANDLEEKFGRGNVRVQ